MQHYAVMMWCICFWQDFKLVIDHEGAAQRFMCVFITAVPIKAVRVGGG